MKFGKQLKAESVSQWKGLYVSYKPLKRLLKRFSYDLELGFIEFEDTDLYRLLEDDLNKVDAFYTEKASTFVAEFESIKQNLRMKHNQYSTIRKQKEYDCTTKTRLSGKGVKLVPTIIETPMLRFSDKKKLNSVSPTDLAYESERGNGVESDSKKQAMLERDERKMKDYKRALLELCVLASELQHYRSLNLTGIRKIIKKIDKKGNLQPPRLQFVMEEVALRPFFVSTRVNDMTVDISSLYREVFDENIEAGLAERKLKLEKRRILAMLPQEFIVWFTISQLVALIMRLVFTVYSENNQPAICGLLISLADELAIATGVVASLWLSWGIPFNASIMSIPAIMGGLFYIAHAESDTETAFAQTIVLATHQVTGGILGLVFFITLHHLGVRKRVTVYLKQTVSQLSVGTVRLVYLLLIVLLVLPIAAVPSSSLPMLSCAIVIPGARRLQPNTRLLQMLLLGIMIVANLFPILLGENNYLFPDFEEFLPLMLSGDNNSLSTWLLVFSLGGFFLFGLELDYQLDKRRKS